MVSRVYYILPNYLIIDNLEILVNDLKVDITETNKTPEEINEIMDLLNFDNLKIYIIKIKLCDGDKIEIKTNQTFMIIYRDLITIFLKNI